MLEKGFAIDESPSLRGCSKAEDERCEYGAHRLESFDKGSRGRSVGPGGYEVEREEGAPGAGHDRAHVKYRPEDPPLG
jgi:hypothetical protein